MRVSSTDTENAWLCFGFEVVAIKDVGQGGRFGVI